MATVRFDEATRELFIDAWLFGQFVLTEAGYYEFFPETRTTGGYVPVEIYEAVVSTWHKLNDEWDASLAEYFKNNTQQEIQN